MRCYVYRGSRNFFSLPVNFLYCLKKIWRYCSDTIDFNTVISWTFLVFNLLNCLVAILSALLICVAQKFVDGTCGSTRLLEGTHRSIGNETKACDYWRDGGGSLCCQPPARACQSHCLSCVNVDFLICKMRTVMLVQVCTPFVFKCPAHGQCKVNGSGYSQGFLTEARVY